MILYIALPILLLSLPAYGQRVPASGPALTAAVVQESTTTTTDGWSIQDWAALIVAAGALGTLTYQLWKDRQDRRQQRIENRKRALRSELDEFYGPLLQLLDISEALYATLHERHAIAMIGEEPATRFRALIALLTREGIDDVDKVLISEINQTTAQAETIIREKGRYAQHEPQLSALLSKAVVHFVVMRLAAADKLSARTPDEQQRLVTLMQDLVYPIKLNEMVRTRRDDLLNELRLLK